MTSLRRPVYFQDEFKTKVWGGRRLESVFGRELPRGALIGESWEVADHPHGMSVVRQGACQGQTLRELVEACPDDLLGIAKPFLGAFPLLVKFIDASADLSVQVHPVQLLVSVGDSVKL